MLFSPRLVSRSHRLAQHDQVKEYWLTVPYLGTTPWRHALSMFTILCEQTCASSSHSCGHSSTCNAGMRTASRPCEFECGFWGSPSWRNSLGTGGRRRASPPCACACGSAPCCYAWLGKDRQDSKTACWDGRERSWTPAQDGGSREPAAPLQTACLARGRSPPAWPAGDASKVTSQKPWNLTLIRESERLIYMMNCIYMVAA